MIKKLKIILLILITFNLFGQDSVRKKEVYLNLEKYEEKLNLISVNNLSTIVISPNNNLSYLIQTNTNFSSKNFVRNNNVSFGITYIINFKKRNKSKLPF